MNSIIYILCPDEEILQNAQLKYSKYEWARFLKLPHPHQTKNVIPLFEHAAYAELLKKKNEWQSCTFVGTLSWRFEEKIGVHVVESKLRNNAYDFVPFFENVERSALNSGTSYHGEIFKEAWNLLLEEAKYDATRNETVECLSSYWACTPRLMMDFCAWHANVLHFAVKYHFELFASDAFYQTGKLSKDELMNLWGRPFYPLLPFVFERFNILFFANNKDCIFPSRLVITRDNRDISAHPIFCIGKKNTFVDIVHNALPFRTHDSQFIFAETDKNETEMQTIRRTLSTYKESNDITKESLFFMFTSPVRTMCCWHRMIRVLQSGNVPFSDLYYVGFCPLTKDMQLWSYQSSNIKVYDTLGGALCKLDKVVYGGGIAFRSSFFEELLHSDSDESLSDYLWKRNKPSYGVFPQFVIPDHENESIEKFCNNQYSKVSDYIKTIF